MYVVVHSSYLRLSYFYTSNNHKMSYSPIRTKRMAAARAKGRHTKSEWIEMKEFFNHTCVKCFGASGMSYVEKDHIIPVYQGGSDSIKNIQPLCARCNCAKGPEDIDHRIKYCKKYSLVMPTKWL